MTLEGKSVTVRARSRAHIGLIDLGFATARAYGGAGFALAGPQTVVRASRSEHSAIDDQIGLTERDLRDLHVCLQQLSAVHPEVVAHLKLEQAPPVHRGFGSKTALLLACLEASAAACGLNLSPKSLQVLSGRAGASGIGVHSYFCGGFIVDGGHKQSGLSDIGPSSARTPETIPPLIYQKQAPQHWLVTLILLPGAQFSGENEREFFARHIPLPEREVLEVLALVYHGLVPALAAENLQDLGLAVREIQRIGFKRREVDAQAPEVSNLLRNLSSECGLVGMSSMGPLLYLIDEREHVSTARRLAPGSTVFGPFSIPSSGRTVSFDD